MIKGNTIVFVVLVCIFDHVLAQSSTTSTPLTTAAPPTTYNCSAATGISFNQTVFMGFWYEVARQPVNTNLGCVQVSTRLLPDNTTLNTNVTFSTTPSTWYSNITESANIKLITNYTGGYNVSFTNTASYIKLLERYNTTDGVQWVAGCSYSNSSDPSTVFAFLLSNAQSVNQTGLNYVYNLASKKFSDFTSKTTNVIAMNQKNCYTSSADSAVPLLSGFVTVLLILMKSLCMA